MSGRFDRSRRLAFRGVHREPGLPVATVLASLHATEYGSRPSTAGSSADPRSATRAAPSRSPLGARVLDLFRQGRSGAARRVVRSRDSGWTSQACCWVVRNLRCKPPGAARFAGVGFQRSSLDVLPISALVIPLPSIGCRAPGAKDPRCWPDAMVRQLAWRRAIRGGYWRSAAPAFVTPCDQPVGCARFFHARAGLPHRYIKIERDRCCAHLRVDPFIRLPAEFGGPRPINQRHQAASGHVFLAAMRVPYAVAVALALALTSRS